SLWKRVVGVVQHIENVNDLALEQGTSGHVAALGCDRQIPDQIDEFGRETVGLCSEEYPALLPGDGRAVGVAKPGSRFHKGVEHGLQIEGRAADDLEYVGGGGLLLQRLAQFVEQAGVLNGNDRLCGEILDQLDLLVGEGAHLLAEDIDGADKLAVL